MNNLSRLRYLLTFLILSTSEACSLQPGERSGDDKQEEPLTPAGRILEMVRGFGVSFAQQALLSNGESEPEKASLILEQIKDQIERNLNFEEVLPVLCEDPAVDADARVRVFVDSVSFMIQPFLVPSSSVRDGCQGSPERKHTPLLHPPLDGRQEVTEPLSPGLDLIAIWDANEENTALIQFFADGFVERQHLEKTLQQSRNFEQPFSTGSPMRDGDVEKVEGQLSLGHVAHYSLKGFARGRWGNGPENTILSMCYDHWGF